MMKRILMTLGLLCLMPLAAQADNFDYSFVEGAYTSVSPQNGNTTSLTGLTVDGSYALNDSWHAIAGYQHVSCCSISDNVLNLGAGWNTHLGEKVDLFIDGEYLSENASGNGTHSGWGATGGVRAALAQQFELDGFVTHTDINSVTENTLGVRGLFSLDRNWRLFASYTNNSDDNTFMVGARYAF